MPESPPLNLPEILASHARWLACDPSGQRANLNGANLNGANLNGASLDRASLDRASLNRANLNGASLNWAKLDGANLNRANLNRVNLNWASLNWAKLDGANLNRASLDGANLNWANLDGANLNWASLDGANLDRASLNWASLHGANLNGANLHGASLHGANLEEVTGIAIAADAPQRLKAVAAAALQDGALEMRTWHTCDTTHCLGGWLIHQAGEAGRLLQAAVGPGVAGLMLGGIEAHSHFYDSNEAAVEWLRSVLARPEVTK
jgi:uncharacterized protein YjbI with pentapeptide repeats